MYFPIPLLIFTRSVKYVVFVSGLWDGSNLGLGGSVIWQMAVAFAESNILPILDVVSLVIKSESM